jgi:thiamine biosynthesis lipoprotein
MALGAGGALGLSTAAWPALLGRRDESLAASNAPELRLSRRISRALGTNVTIRVFHADLAVADDGIDAAFSEIETVEAVMSLYRPESQLCRLNRDGAFDDPHPYLVEVLRAAQEISRRTEGALDVTVQPLWALYAQAKREGRLPSDGEIARAKEKVDWRRLEVSDGRVRLHGRGMAVTLNGVAQGFAADRAADALRRHGVQHALIDAGEIGALGHKPDGQAWRAGIQHPREAEAYIAAADLRDRCLSTSGDYATTFSPDWRYNHIFDPRTGRSPDELASVSIAAPTAVLADALSTAVFVLGVERGLEAIATHPGCDAMFVLKNGRTLTTKGFPTVS